MTNSIKSGYFIELSDKESALVTEYLSEYDYPTGPEGIKKMLMDVVKDDMLGDLDEDAPESPIVTALRENPEMVMGAGKFVGSIVKDFLAKKKG